MVSKHKMRLLPSAPRLWPGGAHFHPARVLRPLPHWCVEANAHRQVWREMHAWRGSEVAAGRVRPIDVAKDEIEGAKHEGHGRDVDDEAFIG